MTTVPPARGLGVRARLLIAFLVIAAFAALAAAAGIHAFREVGARLGAVETRLSPALSALELSRSAERIIAAAPALLAAPDRGRRDTVKADLAAEVEGLKARLRDLKSAGILPPERIEPIVSELTAGLGALDAIVARRLDATERLGSLRRRVFRTNAEIDRLLAPWLQVTGAEIAAGAADPGERGAILTALIEERRRVQAAQRQSAAVADMLADASTTDDPARLPVLEFQTDLALGKLETMAEGLDPRLRPLFLEQVAALRSFAEGPGSIIDARGQELALLHQGEARLGEAAALSAELSAAVDRLGAAARADIGQTIGDALALQRRGTRTLIAVAVLSLLTSVLIVWLYVGGNIVRRLTALSDGMLAIAGGRLSTPVPVRGRDEIAAMACAVETFRRNAIDLERLLEERRETASRLERQVAERTRALSEKSRQLEAANRDKSHFLASAGHDLRQPLHALNLFLAQLNAASDPAERERLIGRVNAAVIAMNELFESLLDMSKLEAGVLEPGVTDFPVARVLADIETTFAETAASKGLRLRVVPSRAWTRSDPVLLERMLMNLVSNAVRCTERGGVVIGCRRRGGGLRIEVVDSGPGIPPAQRRRLFDRGRRPAGAGAGREGGGFGLGLAIVGRLGQLLHHEIAIDSLPGRGARFSLRVPRVAARDAATEPIAEVAAAPALADPAHGRLVVVIDDDPLALEAIGATLQGWGCRWFGADSEHAARAAIRKAGATPDLIISDYWLANGLTGIQAIDRLRQTFGAGIPAFLISGDTGPQAAGEARGHGIHVLRKPISPMRLRAMLNRFLKPRRAVASAAAAGE